MHQSHKNDPLVLAENSFNILARRGKSWQRLRHLVDLALEGKGRTVVDCGTDHGLLAVGLAMTTHFENVLGIDVSRDALQDGALSLQQDILDYRKQKAIHTPLVLEFREGDGLKALQPGEADIVCVAGMGVHSILNIVTATHEACVGLPVLDYLGCKQLLLQPTNVRPRNLILLYNGLQDAGWQPTDERIEYLSGRWYISTAFSRSNRPNYVMPGSKLADLEPSDPQWSVFRRFIEHHCAWLGQDKDAKGKLVGGEEEWLERFATDDGDS